MGGATTPFWKCAAIAVSLETKLDPIICQIMEHMSLCTFVTKYPSERRISVTKEELKEHVRSEECMEFLGSMDDEDLRRIIAIRALIGEGKIEHDFENSCLIFHDEETMQWVRNGCKEA